MGFGCLFAALFIDAYYINKQTEVTKDYKPTIMDMFVSFSLSALVISVISLTVSTELRDSYNFFNERRDLVDLFLTLCVTSTMGQFFIYSCLYEFGGLRLTMITGSRKILTVVLSMIIFRHPVNNIQILSVALIMFSLCIEFYEKIFGGHGKKK